MTTPRTTIPRGVWRAVGVAMLLCLPVPAAAQPSEAAVKAAFLSKFAAYVTWPSSARRGGEQVVICVVGTDPFGNLLDQAARSQQIDGQSIQVKRLQRPDDGAGCAIAFAGGSAMLAPMRGKPILTVTDGRSSVERGMIHFVIQQGRVRFHIDEAQAVRSGLAINSRLLALALSVRQRG